MATPLLDKEILRLRRRLGDIYNEDGTEITASNVYLSTSGVTFPQLELIDIYNDAIRSFLMYMSVMFPSKQWFYYVPGYIVFLPNQAVTSGKLLLSAISPTVFRLMDVSRYAATPVPEDLSVPIDPSEWMAMRNGLTKTRKPDTDHIFHSVMADGTIVSDTTEFLTQADITVINSSTKVITRGTGTFSAGSLVTITLVTIATGDIAYQWTARLITSGASATYTVVEGTDSTFASATQNCSVVVVGTRSVNPSTLYVLPATVAAVDLVYLKDHTDFIQNSSTIDLNGISQEGLRRILIFAEVEARKWKSTESADVSEGELQKMIQQDMATIAKEQ